MDKNGIVQALVARINELRKLIAEIEPRLVACREELATLERMSAATKLEPPDSP